MGSEFDLLACQVMGPHTASTSLYNAILRRRLQKGRSTVSTIFSNARPQIRVDEARTLPQEFYTDPDHFRREMEAIHFATWLAAGRTEQIKEAGDFFVCEVSNASIVVLRDESNVV